MINEKLMISERKSKMNNLFFFRSIAKIKSKQLAKLLNVTVHTYIGFEQERMCIPIEIQAMLSRIYGIDKMDLFCKQTILKSETIEAVKKLSELEECELMNVIKLRLFNNRDMDINYRTIKKIKKEIKNTGCE